MSAAVERERAIGDLVTAELTQLRGRTDRLFVWILLVEWAAGLTIALMISPLAWSGRDWSIHVHVLTALVLGAAINSLPIYLARTSPGWWGTRHTIAVAQMSWSALLIHLTGGRIETHFHVFGSLAFLAAYRDDRVLLTATVTVVLDHLVRGLVWPESIYGIANPEWWRLLEHGTWVVFEDVILILGCRQAVADLRATSEYQVDLEELNRSIEGRVTERTAELEASRERFRTLAESTSAVPWDLDPDTGGFDYIGPQVEQLGYPSEVWQSPDFYLTSAHPDDRDQLREAMRRAVAGEADVQVEYRILAADGSPIDLRSFVQSYVRPDGRIGLRGVSINVSETKKLEFELRQAQKLESVGRLASGIAHEINTPTQFVSDNVHFAREAVNDLLALVAEYRLLMAADANQSASDLVARIASREQEIDLRYLSENLPPAITRSLEGLDRISTIVRSMKEFAHPDQQARVPVDLNRAITNTVTIARSEYKYVADVVTEFAELPRVPCFAGELNQVILNIVVNAAQAIAEKRGDSGRRGTIRIRTRCDRGSAVIEIADDGAGIPEGIRERIFDPFFTTKEVGVGTGQGLAIARSVVEKHGGTIRCASAVGEGTTFKIRLPLEDTHRAAPAIAALEEVAP